MKRTGVRAYCLRTRSTTSTTGPQMRLSQYRGVAKVTTDGRCAASAAATYVHSSARSGGTRVVSAAVRPPVHASVGAFDRYARDPTLGDAAHGRTTSPSTPTIQPLPPTSSATTW